MVKQAEHIASCWGNDCVRRQSRMSRPLELDDEAKREAEREVADTHFRPTDKFDLKIDEEFRKSTKRRFSHWEETLKSVNEVLIDEMLTLLELHYEDVSTEKHKRSTTIFGPAAIAHRKKLNQKLILPARVKEIMQCPKDETNIRKLDLLLNAIRREIEGEISIYLISEDDVDEIARAIAQCESQFYDEVGSGSRIPKGSRLIIEAQSSNVKTSRKKVTEILRSLEVGQTIQVKTRPLGTSRQPPLDTFGREIMRTPYKTTRQLMRDDTIEEIRDKLLLTLWDALFLSTSEQWTNDGVANATASEALDIGWWFQKGQIQSRKPLFEAICAMCGCLLYGQLVVTY